MLHILKTKQDVLTWLYTFGEGTGLPKGAIEHLNDYFVFRRHTKPSVASSFQMCDALTGQVLQAETTSHFAFTMPHRQGLYRPTLDDFEIKFELPAVAFGHYESGADRSGNFKLALFDIKSQSKLQQPRRFCARARLLSVLGYLSAGDLALTQDAYKARIDWFNAADEAEVRRAMTAQLGQDFTDDDVLAPWLMDVQAEFDLFYIFLHGKDGAELQRRAAIFFSATDRCGESPAPQSKKLRGQPGV